ncbi:MAG TPA: PAS domain-containing sensor histidine kinase [Candidatus Saccharimonadales bacterium]|nr:PAS domain-containing sensor histidine kinase [Candidatus Saccharimonadales bacterium]
MDKSAHIFADENALQKLERYQLLVETIEDYAIFLLDETGHVASWNPGAQKFKGYTADEIIGKHFSTFYSKVDTDNGKPAWELEQAKAVGRVEDEGWRLRKDGSRFWANVIITALYDKKTGKHLGFAKVTRNLTERKKYEDMLRDTNMQLQASYKELQMLSAAKDEFVSLASHQLRTPATGVKQYLSLLKDGYAGPLTDLQMDYLQKAYESNDRQIEIVNDLLQVAQLDAGKIVLNKAPTDLRDLITDIVDEQIDSFKARKQTVTRHLPATLPKAIIDPTRFRMVLENLIDNASKYTPEHGKITIKATVDDTGLTVAVADNGVGIDQEDIPKLFEKFTRIPNELTQSVSGSGLGLYWVRKVVELHGGTISVTSIPGKRTTFSIHIPKKELHV